MSNGLDNLIERYPVLSTNRNELSDCLALMIESVSNDGTLFFCGNGGSAADAEHIVGELLKDFIIKRPLSKDDQTYLSDHFGEEGTYLAENLQQGIRSIALTSHPAFTSALANDVYANLNFAQQLHALGRRGDVLTCITTSGNSKNVLHAARVARLKGLKTIALTGRNGGEIKELCDISIIVNEQETHIIQELHLPIYHWLCIELEKYFFGQSA